MTTTFPDTQHEANYQALLTMTKEELATLLIWLNESTQSFLMLQARHHAKVKPEDGEAEDIFLAVQHSYAVCCRECANIMTEANPATNDALWKAIEKLKILEVESYGREG